MIAQLRGILLYKGPTELIIDCSGVGYQAFTSVNSSSKLPENGKQAVLYTILIPREDSLQLYGFADQKELEAFKLLISISGVGPKIALGILSYCNVQELQEFIYTNNTASLQKLPGIGKKTAERIILELKDKIQKLGTFDEGGVISQTLIVQEAVSALVTLGYSRLIAERAVKKAINEDSTIQENAELLIKKSLRHAMM